MALDLFTSNEKTLFLEVSGIGFVANGSAPFKGKNSIIIIIIMMIVSVGRKQI